MRIVGGRHRGRLLQAPFDDRLRPTASRAREAAFNILLHGAPAEARALQDAVVLDAFAGTGALGLEALSRGAARATFIEKDRAVLDLLRLNADRLGETARTHIIAGDATRPPPAPQPADIVFLDPPYGEGLVDAALAALSAAGWIAGGTVVMVESAVKDAFVAPAGFVLLDERRYGKAAISFLLFQR
nr:16S rRNA (guanine(966)-N(2))-methyltransferase RsmD [Stella humosa]